MDPTPEGLPEGPAERLKAAATGSVEAQMAHLAALLNDPQAIIYVRDREGRYVWVSDSYGAQLPYGREQVLGKTNRELFGVAARNWEVADAFASLTHDFITTTEDLWDGRRGFKRWRKFVSTKLILTIGGLPYLVGISVEVKDATAAAYEQRLGQLRARLIERMGTG